MSLVIDASAVAAWAFADERSATSIEVLRRVGREGAITPAIWPFEVANLLLNGERRGCVTRGERSAFLQRLGSLPIVIEHGSLDGLDRTLNLADSYQLTAYDAAHLELAARQRLPLVSKDQTLITAAAKSGVELLPA